MRVNDIVEAPPMEGSALGAPERERLYRRFVGAIAITFGLWRLVMLISKWNVPLHYGDAWYYSIQAINNAHGRWFKEASGPFQNWGVLPGAEHPPLTSLVITPASLLGHPEFWQRATMTLIGIAVIPLFAVLGRRVGGRLVGVLAATVAAVYPNVWLSDSLVMSETLLLFMVVLVVLAAMRYRERFDVRSAVLLGVLIGVAAHARSELLLYAPMFAVIGFRSRRLVIWAKRGAVLMLVAGATVLPWIVYNSGRFETPVLMSTNEGSTWLGANCPLTYGGPSMGGWNLNCLEDGVPPAGEDTAERSVRRRHEAFTFARANSTRLPLVVAARLLRAVDVYGLGENVRADVGEERPSWAIWAGMASWWMLAPLAALGLWRVRRGLRYILLVPLVCVVAVTVVFYGSHRLRAPLEPIVVVGAASTLASMPFIRRAATHFLARTNL